MKIKISKFIYQKEKREDRNMKQKILRDENEHLEINQKPVESRVHRVGTITLGICLIIIGGLFLAHMAFPEISYVFIYKLWPIVFIILGIEILLANFKSKLGEFVYDKTAIILVAGLIMFSMLMAIIGMAIESESLLL